MALQILQRTVQRPRIGLHTVEATSFVWLSGGCRVLDLVVLTAAGLAATAIVTGWYGHDEGGPAVAASAAGAIGAVWSLGRNGAYGLKALVSVAAQLRLMVKAAVSGMLWLVGCLFFFSHGGMPVRVWPIAWVLCAGASFVAGRYPLVRLIRSWAQSGWLARRIAIVGVGELSREFVLRLRDEPQHYRVVGLYDDRHARVPGVQSGIAVRGTVEDLVAHTRKDPVDVIVIALPLSAADRIGAILDKLSSTVADIVLTTDLAGLRYARHQFDGIGGNPVVSVWEAPLNDWRAVQKAVLDHAIGLLALLVLSPVMLLTAVLIRLDSPGPVLFRQSRLGFNNRVFVCYKFRSMRHATSDPLADRQTTRGDERVTRVGRLIRGLSIDELPQLFNVLNGTMSLVGPRPHALNTKAANRLFTDVVRQYALRHRVKPGITGWAQVNGWRGETATVEQIEQRVACDLFYIENWSVRFDIRIMVMTLLQEVRSRHAY